MATNSNNLDIFFSGGEEAGLAQSNSALSLGGFRSIVKVPNGILNNIFDEVGLYEANTGQKIYRCLILKNNHTTDAMVNMDLWIEGKQSFEKIFFGVSLPATVDGAVQKLSSQYEIPYNVDFVEAYLVGDAVQLIASLAAGSTLALWICREIIENEPARNLVSNLTYHFEWT